VFITFSGATGILTSADNHAFVKTG